MTDTIGTQLDEAARPARRPVPRVGILSAWFDPYDPRVWSGVPRALVNELQRLGVFAGNLSLVPWPPVSRAVYRWMKLTGRTAGWARRAEMRALARVSDVASRLNTPRDIDGWVHLVGANGPASRTRYVTLFEMSPRQLLEAGTKWRESLGYPHATKNQMAWVARRQMALYRSAHACCVASRWAADSMVRDHGIEARKIHVVGYGRNANVPPAIERDWSTPRFLFVGRDWGRKNGDAVVRAFTRLRSRNPHARLDIVGNHPPLSVDGVMGHGEIPLGEAVERPGHGRAHIAELFARATCFVLPSFCEPFGIVYVEAAAAGVASIATTNGGTIDSVGEGGVLVDPADDDAIYAAMVRLSDPDTARSLGEIARTRSGDFTWPAMGQRVLRSLDLGPILRTELADFL